ncbi:MAG: EAL domain-containing protein [Oscillospiraceae bacterium]|nr:EAL domain-containing protein [Oscillospiraceae bacterium]
MKKNNNGNPASPYIYVISYLMIYAATGLIAFAISKAMPHHSSKILMIWVSAAIAYILLTAAFAAVWYFTRLRRAKKNVENTIDIMNSMAIAWDDGLSFIRVNKSFTDVLGYTSAQLEADPEILRRILPRNAFEQSASLNSADSEETFAVSKDGRQICTVWTTSKAKEITYHNRTVSLMISMGPDLTEMMDMKNKLVQYSKKLADAEKKFTLSMELSEIGFILKESGDEKFYISEEVRNIFGLNSDYVTYNELCSIIYPGDRYIIDLLAEGVRSVRVGSDTAHTAEFRAMTKDNNFHWFRFRYRLISGGDPGVHGIGGAVMDITAERAKDSLIEKMAYIDEVTQIYNRSKFMLIGSDIYSCVVESGVSGIDYWVIVIDIDNFHIVNDTCGYKGGNKILARIAEVIISALPDDGIAARIGGDDFAVLARADNDEELPVKLIEKIQHDISEINPDSFEAQTVTCSAGYCRITDGGDDFAQVLDRAEFALGLSASAKGSINRYSIYVHDRVIRSTEIEKDLARAIDDNELVLYYQPKIDLITGKVIGSEALIRWIKDGRMIPPNDFIPVAESSMLITKISDYVLREACRQNKEWQDKGLDPVVVSINLTAIDFYHTNVTEKIRKTLEETGLEPKWLEVELTESLALKDIDNAIKQMNDIRNLGVSLSMDDFGTGYSSLSYIQVLPIAVLKLDRSFIMYLEEDEISREIVSAVIRIAKSKKIDTIAEGIETPGQADILRESGCDLAQGYYFGKPMPADKFESFLREHKDDPSKKHTAGKPIKISV